MVCNYHCFIKSHSIKNELKNNIYVSVFGLGWMSFWRVCVSGCVDVCVCVCVWVGVGVCVCAIPVSSVSGFMLMQVS